MSKRFINCLAALLMIVTCTACKAIEPYLTVDYLNELTSKAGLGDGNNSIESLSQLINWGVVQEDEEISEYLNYEFLASTINNLIEDDNKTLDSLKERGWISKKSKNDDLVSKEDALEVIDKAVSIINNKTYKPNIKVEEKENVKHLIDYSYVDDNLISDESLNIGDLIFLKEDNEYKKIVSINNGTYQVSDASFEEIIESLIIEDSYKLDLSEAIDTPGSVSLQYEEEGQMYVNNGKNLLASKRKTFNSSGFRVSYELTSSGISARISKNVNGINMFFDIEISNIKPSYKFNYKDGNIDGAYFKVDYKSVEEIGVSIGRYNNYYLDLKDKDSSSFLNLAKSIIKKKDDEVEATIKICEIKTPIPQMPLLYFNIEVLAKVYTSGKIEVVLSNDNVKGFEVKNGLFRTISENNRDINLKIGGSAKAALGLNFNLEAVKYRLMDIEVDGGIKASVSTTLHLYDDEDNKSEEVSDLVYSAVDELAKENDDVKVCGDLSLNWVLNIRFNTSKTMLYKFGLSKKFEILDEANQVLGNKTHIENFVFVKSCTRKNRYKSSKKETVTVSVDKILLDKYSKVIKIGEEYTINIKALPDGYKESDLIYTSEHIDVASVSTNGTIKGISKGASQVKISTSDNKYSASINVLVSSG